MTAIILASLALLGLAATAHGRMAAVCSSQQTPRSELHCGQRNLHQADSLKRFLVTHPEAGTRSDRRRLYRDARWLKRYGLWHVERARARMQPTGVAGAWAWYWRPDTQCEVSHEGGWTSVNPAGYYGRFQMDVNFMNSTPFGRSMYQRYGTADHWPHWAQVYHAWIIWRVRGWSPWPPYYRFGCGG